MPKTLRAKKEWFAYLQDHAIGSSGEGGNLIGMRRIWGKDAYVVRCCNYLFYVPEETFRYVFENT